MHGLDTIKKLNGEWPEDQPVFLTERNKVLFPEGKAVVMPYDTVGQIVAYEAGELDSEGVITLFQYLVNTGLAWSLQGSYGRQAQAMIEAGVIGVPGFNTKWHETREERDFSEAKKAPRRKGNCAP